MTVLVLILAFAIILVGAELFTNGVEWMGHKLELAEGAVGSVLAAVGTALPETMIPLIAILFATGEGSNEIGIGAILGAPFMLATLAMFVTGVAVLAAARHRAAGDVMLVDPIVLWHDVRFFAIAYLIAILVAFVPADVSWPRWAAAALLVGIYAYYVRQHLGAEAAEREQELRPLRMHRLDVRGPARPDPPRLRIVTTQVLTALALIVAGAFAFVAAVEQLAFSLGVDQALLALVIAPIATELPEKFNSVIWVRQDKDTLAMGNITGAMVFQSAIPTVIALVFATEAWAITSQNLLVFASAGIAFLSCAAIFIPMSRHGRLRGRGLLVGGGFYALYLVIVLAQLGGVGA